MTQPRIEISFWQLCLVSVVVHAGLVGFGGFIFGKNSRPIQTVRLDPIRVSLVQPVAPEVLPPEVAEVAPPPPPKPIVKEPSIKPAPVKRVKKVSRRVSPPVAPTAAPAVAPLLPPPPPTPTKPVRVVRAPKPPYPLTARREGFEGRGVFSVKVGRLGRVLAVDLLESTGRADCDKSALETIREHWRFKPAEAKGERIESSVKIAVSFSLRD